MENSLGHRPRMLTLSCQCFKFQTASYPTVTVLSPSNNIPYYLRVYGTSFPRLPTVSLFQVTTALPTGQRYCTKDTRAYHSPNSYWGKIAWLKPTAQLSSTPSFEVPSRRHARWTVGKKVMFVPWQHRTSCFVRFDVKMLRQQHAITSSSSIRQLRPARKVLRGPTKVRQGPMFTHTLILYIG